MMPFTTEQAAEIIRLLNGVGMILSILTVLAFISLVMRWFKR